MVTTSYCPYTLQFNFTARTSRETMHVRPTWLIRLQDAASGAVAYGECPLFRGLSADDVPNYDEVLAQACARPEDAVNHPFSSIRFGFEMAFANLKPVPNDAWHRGEKGIAINGLIWMGDKATMAHRIAQKLDDGFDVLKLKIGGINFDDEVELLSNIRTQFSADALTIRLDANGSFSPENALERLERLSQFNIHSLEQPVAAGQVEAMAEICRKSPIDIALDEELIGTTTIARKTELLDAIRPHYVILKPALCGGISGAKEWIAEAEKRGIGYWLTSALESNIGLEAIGSLAAELNSALPQGLGTGQLYTNNFPSPLQLRGQYLFYCPGAENAGAFLEQLPWRS